LKQKLNECEQTEDLKMVRNNELEETLESLRSFQHSFDLAN